MFVIHFLVLLFTTQGALAQWHHEQAVPQFTSKSYKFEPLVISGSTDFNLNKNIIKKAGETCFYPKVPELPGDIEDIFNKLGPCNEPNPLKPINTEKYCMCMRTATSSEAKIGSIMVGGRKRNYSLVQNNYKSSYMQDILQIRDYETDRSSEELKKRFDDFMHGNENVADSYTFLNMGLILDAKKNGLEAEGQKSIQDHTCSLKESKNNVRKQLAMNTVTTLAISGAGPVSNVASQIKKFEDEEIQESKSITAINRLAGSCFTAEEFTEFRSFPDTNVINALASQDSEKLLNSLNADSLLGNSIDSEGRTILKGLTSEELSFKKYLQGNPLLAVFFLTPVPKGEAQRAEWNKNRESAIVELKKVAKEAQGLKSGKERLKLFRDFNSKMKNFLNNPSVQEDINTSQRVQCDKLEIAYTVGILDTRPTIFDVESFDRQNNFSEFCEPGHPMYTTSRGLCVRKSSLRCFAHENSGILKEQSKQNPGVLRELTRADKGMYHLTRTLSDDLKAQAYDLESKLCSGISAKIQAKCEEGNDPQACMLNATEDGIVKIKNRDLIKNELLVDSNPSYIEGNILREMMIENMDKPYSEKWSTNDRVWESGPVKVSAKVQARYDEAIKNLPMLASSDNQKDYVKKLSSRNKEIKELNQIVQKSVSKISDSFNYQYEDNNKPAAPLHSNVVATSKKISKEDNTSIERSIDRAISQNLPIELPSILPTHFNNFSIDEKKAVIAKVEKVLDERASEKLESNSTVVKSTNVENSNHEESSIVKSLKESNSSLQDQLISGLRSQLEEMKAQISSLKDNSDKNAAGTKVANEASKEKNDQDYGQTVAARAGDRTTYINQSQGSALGPQSTGGFQPIQDFGGNSKSSAAAGKFDRQSAINDNASIAANRAPASQGGLEVVSANSEITMNTSPVVFDEKKQLSMHREEIKLDTESFREVRSNESKLKIYIVGMKLGEESIITVSEKSLNDQASSVSLQYYVKKDSKGGFSISPVNRAKLEDLKRNILSVQAQTNH